MCRPRAIAFNRLLGVVSGGSAGTEQQAQQLVNRRLRAYQDESQRLADLMQPYMTPAQRKLLQRAGGV